MTIVLGGVKYTVPDAIMKGFGEIALCDPSNYRGRECPPVPLGTDIFRRDIDEALPKIKALLARRNQNDGVTGTNPPRVMVP